MGTDSEQRSSLDGNSRESVRVLRTDRARTEPGREDSAWVAFVGGLRTSLAHDLRTPLGAIANYAAVLEHAQGSSPSEVRNTAHQIRHNVLRTVHMLEQLAAAAAIAASAPPNASAATPVDARVVLVRALSDLGARPSIRDRGFEDGSVAKLDGALLDFAWRAYLALERDVSGRLPESVEVQLEQVDRATCLTLIVGVGVDPRGPASDLSHFLVQAGDSARLESRHALRLADQLVRLRNGTLELHGRAGNGSALRLQLPPA
jgi:signal transduction histidine kinase